MNDDKKTNQRTNQLLTNRIAYIAYIKMKIDEEDWHGVSDAANDLREIDAETRGLKRDE